MKIKNAKLTLAIFTGLAVAGFAFFTAALENSPSDKNIFLDSDQDGLSNEEEKTYGTDPENKDTDGDGYSDGAEVKSGYDPLVPAPGDKIIKPRPPVMEPIEIKSANSEEGEENEGGETENKNLTEEVSVKIAEMVSNPDPENQEITLEDIDELIQETMGNEMAFEDLPEIDEAEIKIKEQDYSSLSEEKREAKEKEDALEYLTAVSYIAVNNVPYKIFTTDDLEKFTKEIVSQVALFSSNFDITYFEDLADKGEQSLEQLSEIEVPENLLDLHIKGLQLMEYAISLREKARPDAQDPISNIIGLSKFQNLLVLGNDFMEDIIAEMEKLEITEIPIEF